ncbi:hypothetical protein ACUOCP_55175, partial [Escherichia sp. R-CC3]
CSPMQLALVDYLSTRRYDAHLRRLRRQLAERKQRAWQALLRYLPAEVKIHHSDSGYFLWPQRPTNCFGKLGYSWTDSAPAV